MHIDIVLYSIKKGILVGYEHLSVMLRSCLKCFSEDSKQVHSTIMALDLSSGFFFCSSAHTHVPN